MSDLKGHPTNPAERSQPWQRWVRQHRVLLVASLLGAAIVVALLALVTERSVHVSAWWPALLAMSLILLGVNWVFQWRPDAPPRESANRGPRLLLGMAWLVPAVLCCGAFGRASGLPSDWPGIARFELVGDASGARLLARQTGGASYPEVAHQLRESVSADWWFILSYVALLVGLSLWLGHYLRMQQLRDARFIVAAVALTAGVLDVLENLSLWRASTHLEDPGNGSAGAWATTASLAWPKFVLALIVVAYVVGALVSLLWSRQWTRTRGPMPFWEALAQPPQPDPMNVHRTLASQDAAGTRRKLGIALSGGGIRASSISLGALQVLESSAPGIPAPRLGWGQADEVTAISGGSNMASGWSIARSSRRHGPRDPEGRAEPGGASTPDQPDDYDVIVGSAEAWQMGLTPSSSVSAEERHLFDNLGYLVATSPRGDERDVAATEWAVEGNPGASRNPPPRYQPPAYATVLTGFLINVTVFLAFLWLSVRPLGWLYRFLVEGLDCDSKAPKTQLQCLSGQSALATPGLALVAVGVIVLVIWVAADRNWAKTESDLQTAVLSTLKGIAQGALAIGALLIVLLIVFPFAMSLASILKTAKQASLVSLIGSVGTITPVVRLLRKPATRIAPVIGGIVFMLLMTFLAAFWAYGSFAAQHPRSSFMWWLVAGVAALVIYTGADPASWSLAPFYRGKLRLAYATRRTSAGVTSFRNDSDTNVDSLKEPSLHTFVTRKHAGTGTPLTICTTCTVSSRAVKTHYGIPALSVTFDPSTVRMFIPQDNKGTWAEYSCATWAMDSLSQRFGQGRLTTMLAVAISSAAVSPAMGRFRVGPTSMLLTFANVRLGVWMPNPRYVSAIEDECKRLAESDVTAREGESPEALAARRLERTKELFELQTYPKVRFGYLFKEFFGIHDTTDAYLYLTDGGHWENTGLVELLRRGNFREIVCVDADPGPGDTVRSLSQAIDLAALECDALVNVNLDPLRASTVPGGGPAYSGRSVTVGFFELQGSGLGTPTIDGDRVGVLWYSKPALTPDMPAALLAHRETHPDYPRISTFDQFFDASTFIAYRDLGRYNAQVVRRARWELLNAMTWSERRFVLVEPVYEEFRNIDADYPAQIETFIASKDRFTARLLQACAADPRIQLTEFEVFSTRVDDHWACAEIDGLVRRRVVDPQQRDALYQAIKTSLRLGRDPDDT